MNVARFEEARLVLEQAVAAAAAAGADAIAGYALNSLGVVLGYLGELDSGRQKLAASREIAVRLGDVAEVGRADSNLIDLLVHVGGRFDEAARLASDTFTYLQESYLASFFGVYALSEGAGALIRAGLWEEADGLLDRAQWYLPRAFPRSS